MTSYTLTILYADPAASAQLFAEVQKGLEAIARGQWALLLRNARACVYGFATDEEPERIRQLVGSCVSHPTEFLLVAASATIDQRAAPNASRWLAVRIPPRR